MSGWTNTYDDGEFSSVEVKHKSHDRGAYPLVLITCHDGTTHTRNGMYVKHNKDQVKFVFNNVFYAVVRGGWLKPVSEVE